jgi:protein arginine kinase activator
MRCMYCEKEATIHLTEILNDQMQEIHLCEVCSKEHQGDLQSFLSAAPKDMAIEIDALLGTSGEKKKLLKCASCGMTSKEFSEEGRLGCPECYHAFEKILVPLLKRFHRGNHHLGKKPKKISKKDRAICDLRMLQEKLRQSIDDEAFEDAAKIRDKIKKLEIKKPNSPKNDKQ